MECAGSENGVESTCELRENDRIILNFMDSMDSYLILMDSLSAALRQGWLELASARHSMGTYRVNSSLFDLKSHHASTTLAVHDETGFPQFTLCKWASSNNPNEDIRGAELEEDEPMQKKSNSELHDSDLQEKKVDDGESPVASSNQVQKVRLKSLSMFGTLVSPKIHSTQLSFESALEILVEISNARASMLHAHDQLLQKDLKNTE